MTTADLADVAPCRRAVIHERVVKRFADFVRSGVDIRDAVKYAGIGVSARSVDLAAAVAVVIIVVADDAALAFRLDDVVRHDDRQLARFRNVFVRDGLLT